jgi:hypothetical protein
LRHEAAKAQAGDERAAGEREEEGVGDRRHADAEFLGDLFQDEGQDEEIEGVERPVEIGGDDRARLRSRSCASAAPSHSCRHPPRSA